MDTGPGLSADVPRADDPLADGPALRPQALLLIFFGDYVAQDGLLVASSGVITLLGRIGVGEQAARATLARMTRRGLLRRELRGRRAYFGLTDHGRRTTAEGRARATAAERVTRSWDGRWTVVAFSMPESWQRERHDVRSRLTWAGFGMAQSGLWVAPRTVDVPELLRDVELAGYVRAFDAVPLPPTDAGRLVAEAYDLDALARRFVAFSGRWRHLALGPRASDPLATRVMLTADWAQVVRDDPRLPPEFLPAHWPAFAADRLFRTEFARLRAGAQRQFAREVETVATGTESTSRSEGTDSPG